MPVAVRRAWSTSPGVRGVLPRRSSIAARFCVGIAPQLAKDLTDHEAVHGTDGSVHIAVFFPPGFPAEAPTVRMERPVMRKDTGPAVGGAFCIPALFKEAWDPSTMRMPRVLEWIKSALVRGGARVDMETANGYSVEAFSAVQRHLQSRISMVELASGRLASFNDPFVAVSARFAETYFDDEEVHIPADFEQGNRVLVPRTVFAEVSGLMSNRAFVVEIVGHHLVRTYCGIAGSHGVDATDMPAGARVVILPNWVAASLHVPDGVDVAMRPVELPKLNFLQIQPFSREFAAIDSPKEFLQVALSKHSCVTQGAVVSFREGGRDLSFYVTAMHPAVPAATVWTGDWEAKLNLDILPAQDDVEAATEAGRGPPAAAAAAAAGAPPRTVRNARRRAEAAAASSSSSSAAADGGASEGKDGDDDAAAAAAAAAAVPDQRHANAEFAAWRRQQDAIRDLAAADALRDGVPVSGLDAMAAAGARVGRIRVRLMPLPLAPEAVPSDVVVRVADSTTCAQLYSTLRAQFTPPGVPFVLVRGQDGSHVPDATLTVASQGVMGKALGQRIIPGDACDACIRRTRRLGGSSGPAGPGQPSAMELPYQIQELGDEVGRLLAQASAPGAPASWCCDTCTVQNEWALRDCAVCGVGQRPTEQVAKSALRETADIAQVRFEAARIEYVESRAASGPAGSSGGAAAASSSSSSSSAAIGPVATADFGSWLLNRGVDEEELPKRLRHLRRHFQDLAADSRPDPATPPAVYHCAKCTLQNGWDQAHCCVCGTPRPHVREARRGNAAKAEAIMAEAKREHSSILSSSALSLTRSASLSRGASAGDDDAAVGAGGAAAGDDDADGGGGLRTHVVFGGTVCLCEEHRCGWLEELYQSQQLQNEDLPLITADTVLDMLESTLL